MAKARPAEAALTEPLQATATDATVTMVKVPNKSIRRENQRLEKRNIDCKKRGEIFYEPDKVGNRMVSDQDN